MRIGRSFVAAWRLLRMLVHVVHGIVLMALRFESLDAAGRHAHVQWWSATLLCRLGIGITVKGAPHAGATLIAANHVSWLDIAALHAAVPQARFVSKSDIKHWPLVGRMVAGAGTLFIERESKRDALRVVHQMAAALHAGDTVAVFPEGTTGEGRELLPFHANLLQAAVVTGVPVQAAVLRFYQPGQAFSEAVEFVGATTLAQSLWRMACAKGLAVEVNLLEGHVGPHRERRVLAAQLRERIGDELAQAD